MGPSQDQHDQHSVNQSPLQPLQPTLTFSKIPQNLNSSFTLIGIDVLDCNYTSTRHQHFAFLALTKTLDIKIRRFEVIVQILGCRPISSHNSQKKVVWWKIGSWLDHCVLLVRPLGL